MVDDPRATPKLNHQDQDDKKEVVPLKNIALSPIGFARPQMNRVNQTIVKGHNQQHKQSENVFGGMINNNACRFIPRRGDSIDGDQQAWLLAESSCSLSADREVSSYLNLSMDPKQIQERQQEHKTNVMAVKINHKAIRANQKYTTLGRGTAEQHQSSSQVHGMMLPMRNLKLTQRDSRARRAEGKRSASDTSHDSFDYIDTIRGIEQQFQHSKKIARQLKQTRDQKRQQRVNEMTYQREEDRDKQLSTVSVKLRQRKFPLKSQPLRVLAADDVNIDLHANQLLDWGPQYNPFAQKKLLALAIQNSVFIQDVLVKGAPLEPIIETQQSESVISSISFDRTGGALLVAKKTGLVQIYDVSTGQRLRQWQGSVSSNQTCNIVSYCRSVVAPYMVSVGHGAMVGIYDVRSKDPSICLLTGHQSDICTLSWSVNNSSDLMRQSSSDQVYLASGGTDGTLGIWTLSEIIRGRSEQIVYPKSSLFMSQISQNRDFCAEIRALAWHPNQQGLLATGCSSPDQYIRIWDFSQNNSTPSIDEDCQELKHSILCRQGITSLSWLDFTSANRNNDICSEMVSTHADLRNQDCSANKMSLWQVNQVQSNPTMSQQKQFFFSKVKDFYSNYENDSIFAQTLSPCGQNVATLSTNEQISIWNLFEKRSVDLPLKFDRIILKLFQSKFEVMSQNT